VPKSLKDSALLKQATAVGNGPRSISGAMLHKPDLKI
jgi:hypothetical protein